MRLKNKDIGFVVVQALLFVAYVYNYEIYGLRTSTLLIILGIVLTAIGFIVTLLSILQLNKNLSPFPTPKTNSELVQYGLYRYIRHPIYTGILFLAFGISLLSLSLYRLLITLVLLVLFYYKSNYEEEQLQKKFPAYDSYKKSAGRFLPIISKFFK